MFKDIDRKDRMSGLKKTDSTFTGVDRNDRTTYSADIGNNIKPTGKITRYAKATLHSEFNDEIKIIPRKSK